MKCPVCGFKAKSAQGLVSHRRWRHQGQDSAPEKRAKGEVRQAVEQTLDLLTQAGRIEAVDAARVQMLRSMADALDSDPFQSRMWHEFREALEGLTGDDSDDDTIKELLAEMSSTVQVRDKKKT